MNDGQQLIADYVKSGSESAFRELVSRYVDLVYSSAIRLVNGDIHLAEDVTQTVFTDLARMARTLSRDVMLGGWLHRHTCFVASKAMRGERRRRERERQAMEMNLSEDHSAANLAAVAPALDEAINELGAEDRAAILLRFFEQRDFRSVGEALGSNEEAARKRVDRALDKLHGLLSRRGVALSAAALATTLSAGVVSAAPTGLAVTVSSAALAGVATGGTTLTLLQIITMTKLQAGIISAVVIAGIAIPIVLQQKAQRKYEEANRQALLQVDRANKLERENEELLKQVAAARKEAASAAEDLKKEVVRLRADNARLSGEKSDAVAAKTSGPSAVSGLKANPEMWKSIRNTQKMGLSMIYSDFNKRLSLSEEQGGKLGDLLADGVMENIDKITELLKEKKSPEEANQVFTAQEAAMNAKVKELLGDEGYAQYLDYTKNLASYITAEQFKGMMTGEKDEKDAKAKKMYELLLAETQRTLAKAGLPSDYQLVPTMNFRNFVSDSVAEGNLNLLSGIYDRATTSFDFLSPEELKKFGDFREMAINQNRTSLALNRKLMSPGTN